MRKELAAYLQEIKSSLSLDPAREEEVLREMHDHLEDRLEDLMRSGQSRSEAVAAATAAFGQPRSLARDISQVHGMQSWSDAALAAAPYLAVSLLFGLHLWESLGWLVLFFMSSVGMTLLGWWQGKPQWMYPWAGYSLVLPLVAAVIAAMAVGLGFWRAMQGAGFSLPIWAYLGLAAYVPLGLGLVVSVMHKVIQRDWLFASLMMLPFPVLARWLLSLQWEGNALVVHRPSLAPGADDSVALLFLCLAITPALFLRLRRRPLKILVIVGATPPALFVASSIVPGSWTTPWVLAFAALSVALLLAPALVDLVCQRQQRHQSRPSSD